MIYYWQAHEWHNEVSNQNQMTLNLCLSLVKTKHIKLQVSWLRLVLMSWMIISPPFLVWVMNVELAKKKNSKVRRRKHCYSSLFKPRLLTLHGGASVKQKKIINKEAAAHHESKANITVWQKRQTLSCVQHFAFVPSEIKTIKPIKWLHKSDREKQHRQKEIITQRANSWQVEHSACRTSSNRWLPQRAG